MLLLASMLIETLDRRETAATLVITVGLAGTLAVGFIPVSRELFHYVAGLTGGGGGSWTSLGEMAAFPLLALFFYLTLPSRKEAGPLSARQAIEASLLPIAIAIPFGLWLRPGPSLFEAVRTPGGIESLLWYVVLAPLGEEWLFRGWLYRFMERFTRGRFASVTNPLPAALWASAIAFSLWHAQSFGVWPEYFVVFQIVYTFFTGLFFGYLRWKTGKVTAPILSHLAINLAAAI